MILRKDGMASPAPGGLELSPIELPFPLGAQIAGCSILKVAGAGPRGVVYLANSEKHQGHVALKALYPGVSCRPDLARDLDPEKKTSISHPNLAGVYRYGEERGCHFYVRPFLRGDSLERVILDLKRGKPEIPHLAPFQVGRDGRLHPRFYYAVARIFAELAGALHLAHERGLVHGRVHPGNLIFSPTGRLVLTDFAGLAEDARGGRTAAADPSLPYRAPEQLEAFHEGKPLPQDPQTDVYALGAVLHHLVFRELPSQAGEAAMASRPLLKTSPRNSRR
jgi:serine/threonine-protein kinase